MRVRVGGVAVAALLVCGFASACTSNASPGGAPPSTTSSAPAGPVASVSIADAAENVQPATPLRITALRGDLLTVVVKNSRQSVPVKGTQTAKDWILEGMLTPDASYTVNVTVKLEDGKTGNFASKFSTLTPEVKADYIVIPDGDTVGVGMPVQVNFASAVAEKYRPDIERKLEITTVPEQEGAWAWVSENQVMWRPKVYWKANSKITVKANLTGLRTGDKKWIMKNKGATFTTGNARISTVNLSSHTMTVKQNGSVIRTYPISGGKATPIFETRSGVKVITEMLRDYTMKSSTVSLPKDEPEYEVKVKYAMRVTDTGEFLHDAPWSVASQGKANVSHGCVNMAPAHAAEMFSQSRVGDVVEFIGSNRQMRPDEGLGVWVYGWPEWQEMSALRKDAQARSGDDTSTRRSAD